MARFLIPVVLLAIAHIAFAENTANVEIISSGNCGAAILKKKGVDTRTYKPKVIFDPKNLRLNPAKPTVPGCFHLVANNVTFLEPMKQITAEFEMRIAGDADPNKPTLQCKQKTRNCGCGDNHSCMYCDFCKNIHRIVNGAVVNSKTVDVQSLHESCDCDIPDGAFQIDAEVCTPDASELGDNVPTEVLSFVSEGTSFSLFTTLYIYNFRYNALSGLGSNAEAALKARKAKGLVGCYVVASNVAVQLD